MQICARSVLFFSILLAVEVNAEPDWDWSANIELQGRFFTQDAAWPGQESRKEQTALTFTPELRWRNDEGDQRVSLIPYARWDEVDDERSLVDLREGYWAFEGDAVEVLLGVNTVFWGVTESVHLVDIINQTDGVGDIDGEDKLGQPMFNIAVQRDWGLLSGYFMAYFRERTFPGVEGRLRAPLAVDTDNPEYESAAENHHTDIALRYSHYIGDIDIGVSLFSGTSREPRLMLSEDAPVLIPHYDHIEQLGIDLQYTRDAWLWKLEAMVRDGYSHSFAAAVAGFEYTVFQINQSAADLGLLLELQYDGRNSREPVTINDNDIFMGARLAMNDIQDTSLLAGVAYDVETQESFFNIEAERRFGQDVVVELRVRFFSGAKPDDVTYAIVEDDYIQLQVAKYF